MRRELLAVAVAAVLAALAGCDGDCPCRPVPGMGQYPVTPVNVKPFAIGTPDLVMLVTGGTNGMMEVCNCSGPMPGGLARRSGLVKSYREACSSVFLLDLGDLFWVEPEDIRNGFVLRAYRQIGYDAVVLGDQEWASKGLAGMLGPSGGGYLSTNVAGGGATRPLPVMRTVKRRLGHVKLAVLSYVSPEAFRFAPEGTTDRAICSPPDAVRREAAALKSSGHVVVLVAHVEQDQVEAIATRSGADLVIRGHTTRCDEGLARVGTTPVARIGGHPYVGVLAMKITPGGRVEKIEYRIETVTDYWPMDRRLIETYQAYAHAAMRKALGAEPKAGLDYVPSAACGKCHQKQYAAWSAGPHARAYATLRRARRTGDPNCLGCHTTGFGTGKGFYTFNRTPHLAGVNCQNCHRFGVTADHESKAFKRTRPRVDEEICTTCHTPVTDPKKHFVAPLEARPYRHR